MPLRVLCRKARAALTRVPIRGDVHVEVAGAGDHWSVHVI